MAPRKKPAAKYHHGDLREALLATAWNIVSRKGVSALSLRSVAQEVGVSYAAPAHHFRGKGALVEALRNEAWLRFAIALEIAEERGLRELGRAYVKFAMEHPRQMELMFRSGPPRVTDSGERGGRAWQALARAVAKTIGPKRAADPQELNAMSMAAWAGVHGLASLLTEIALPEPLIGRGFEVLRERVLDVVIAGIET